MSSKIGGSDFVLLRKQAVCFASVVAGVFLFANCASRRLLAAPESGIYRGCVRHEGCEYLGVFSSGRFLVYRTGNLASFGALSGGQWRVESSGCIELTFDGPPPEFAQLEEPRSALSLCLDANGPFYDHADKSRGSVVRVAPESEWDSITAKP
jgi:hypothetical protein